LTMADNDEKKEYAYRDSRGPIKTSGRTRLDHQKTLTFFEKKKIRGKKTSLDVSGNRGRQKVVRRKK